MWLIKVRSGIAWHTHSQKDYATRLENLGFADGAVKRNWALRWVKY